MVSLRGFFTRRIGRKFKRALGGSLLIVAAVTTWEFRTPFTSYGHYLSNALAAQRNADEAIAELRQVVRISPQSASAHSNLGVALERQGKVDDAVAEHREALRIDPNYPGFHYNLGIALSKQGMFSGFVWL